MRPDKLIQRSTEVNRGGGADRLLLTGLLRKQRHVGQARRLTDKHSISRGEMLHSRHVCYNDVANQHVYTVAF